MQAPSEENRHRMLRRPKLRHSFQVKVFFPLRVFGEVFEYLYCFGRQTGTKQAPASQKRWMCPFREGFLNAVFGVMAVGCMISF